MAVLQQVWLPLLLSAVLAYLLGSCNFAIIVSKTMLKEDIREKGSGNAGATNMLRSHGKGPAALTSVGDLAKSIVAVLVARFVLFPAFDAADFAVYGAYVAGFFCVLGHMYPLYFGFRGGKGVMTVLGMMLVLDWVIALLGLAVFIVVVWLWRMVSLGSIVAGTSICVSLFVKLKFFDGIVGNELLFCVAMVVLTIGLAIAKHSENIKRILNGTESKFGSKKK